MGLTVQGSNPTRGKGYSSAQICPDQLCSPPRLLFNGYGGCSTRVKQLGHDINHSPPSTAEVKHEWGCTFIPLVGLHGVYRDNFNFLLLPCSLQTLFLNFQSFHDNNFIKNVYDKIWKLFLLKQNFWTNEHILCIKLTSPFKVTLGSNKFDIKLRKS